MVVTLRNEIAKCGPALAPRAPRVRFTMPITRDMVTIRNAHSYGGAAVLLALRGFTGAHAGGVSTLEMLYGGQAYFWTKEWQSDEAQVDADYAAGRFYEPKDARDLIRWLREG